jgi:phosphopantothenoylcysteine decarboxylase/phosphopantothenate--cysteine ligase
MLVAVQAALPANVGIFAAAVADWRTAGDVVQKLKKDASGPPRLELVENPDTLATVSKLKTKRPKLVIGFAAETEKVIEHAKAKLKRKGSDWIVANDVSAEGGAMGGDDNAVHLITAGGVESWPSQSKDGVARQLVARIAAALNGASR